MAVVTEDAYAVAAASAEQTAGSADTGSSRDSRARSARSPRGPAMSPTWAANASRRASSSALSRERMSVHIATVSGTTLIELGLTVSRPTDRGEHRALHGLTRTLVANMVQGVTNGFEKRLEIQGVGYRAALRGRDLELALGYSHPVSIKAPDGIEFEVPQPTRITVKGASKQQVGEIAALIRKQRKPEPYKGKGIRYEGEYVARKVGKRA